MSACFAGLVLERSQHPWQDSARPAEVWDNVADITPARVDEALQIGSVIQAPDLVGRSIAHELVSALQRRQPGGLAHRQILGSVIQGYRAILLPSYG